MRAFCLCACILFSRLHTRNSFYLLIYTRIIRLPVTIFFVRIYPYLSVCVDITLPSTPMLFADLYPCNSHTSIHAVLLSLHMSLSSYTPTHRHCTRKTTKRISARARDAPGQRGGGASRSAGLPAGPEQDRAAGRPSGWCPCLSPPLTCGLGAGGVGDGVHLQPVLGGLQGGARLPRRQRRRHGQRGLVVMAG